VWCITHQLWNLHGLAPRCNVTESDGTFFLLDESNPGEITGRKPHHDHAGEFWIECQGYAPLDIRRKIFARKPPTETHAGSPDRKGRPWQEEKPGQVNKTTKGKTKMPNKKRPDQKNQLVDVAELQCDPGKARAEDFTVENENLKRTKYAAKDKGKSELTGKGAPRPNRAPRRK
jgi:hypothetical protein